jgi:hypothetical protein
MLSPVRKSVTQSPCSGVVNHGMAHCPLVLKTLIFVRFGIVDIQRGLKPRKGGLTWDFPFNFVQDLPAILS